MTDAQGMVGAEHLGLIPEWFADDFNTYYLANTLMTRITTGKFYEKAIKKGNAEAKQKLSGTVDQAVKEKRHQEGDQCPATR